MVEKSPAFQFYPKDWLSSWRVQSMTPEQRGGYIQLLCHAWLQNPQGTLPDDPEILAQMSGLNDRWTTVGQSLIDMFDQSENHPGRLEHSRLQKELARHQKRKSDASRAGKLSAQARLQSPTNVQRPLDDRSTIVNPSSSSASSSSSAKKRKRSSSNDLEHPRFNEFWKCAYRKTKKVHAIKAFAKACEHASIATILKAWTHQNNQWCQEAANKKYVPHPSTWLNGKQWDDEIISDNSDERSASDSEGLLNKQVEIIGGPGKGAHGTVNKHEGGEVTFYDKGGASLTVHQDEVRVVD